MIPRHTESRRVRQHRVSPVGVVVTLLVTFATACGDGGVDVAAACDASIAVDRAFNLEEDLEAGVTSLRALVAAAPEDVGSQVEPLVARLEEDPEAALASEALATADAAIDAFVLAQCADDPVDLEAVNFAYTTSMGTALDAGRTVFHLRNRTQTGEFHEAILLRTVDDSGDGPQATLAQALTTPVSVETTLAALQPFTMLAVGFVEPEGNTEDVFVVDLEPGQYVFACLLPVDSPSVLEAYFDGEDVEGARHFDRGMYVEFTVT